MYVGLKPKDILAGEIPFSHNLILFLRYGGTESRVLYMLASSLPLTYASSLPSPS